MKFPGHKKTFIHRITEGRKIVEMIKIFLVCRDEVEKKLYGNDRSVSGEAQSIIASCNPIHLINTLTCRLVLRRWNQPAN